MLELLRMGGIVTWIIIGCGLVAFIVFLERAWNIHRARIKSEDFLKGIMTVLSRNNIEEALTLCEETPGPVAYLVKTAILHRNESREQMKDALDEAGLIEIARIERRIVVLTTIAQVAPLLGILGTALGMIDVMIVLQHQSPLVQISDVFDGVIKALVSTAAGLTIAIPCYVAYTLLNVKIGRVALDMERSKSEIITFFVNQQSVINHENKKANSL
jgi:biopolymer transport protein ExbB